MSALFGFIQFDESESYSEKNRLYLNSVFTAFPSRFPAKKIVEHHDFSIAGTFETAYNGNDEAAEKKLFFNGEIYNRGEIERQLQVSSSKFQTDASLVFELIRQKGLEAVRMVNGQFLIIYEDQANRKVHLLNDHLGVRQLYYFRNKNILLFSTEIKFLLAHPEAPKELDWASSLKRPHPKTVLSCSKDYTAWFKDVYLLPEGSVLTAATDGAEIKVQSYWNVRKTFDYAGDNRTAGQVMEEYISLLDNAVKIRTGNEPLSYSLLSGGLDSSAVSALSAGHKPTETFSIITQTTCLEETTEICRRLAHELHFRNTQYLMPVHEVFFNSDLWKQLVWRMESPVNHTDALTKTLLHHAIRQHHPEVKAVFTGTGSDQFNGGLVKWLVNDAGNADQNWTNFDRAIKDVENKKLIARADDDLWSLRQFIHRDYLAAISRQSIESNTWLFYVEGELHSEVFSLLWDEVRASGYHGHETRFPFLDFRFMEFIAQIPPRLHKELFYDKMILRAPMKKYLPEYVLNKHKVPSYIPEYDFRFRLYDFLMERGLMRDAFGNPDEPHPVIDKRELSERIEKIRREPEIMEWLNIMRIINLGLLEQLPGKTEGDLNIESWMEPEAIDFTDNGKAKLYLKKKLSIRSRNVDLQKPIVFCENCSLLFDKLNNKYYLAKNQQLAFEIEEQYADWKNFLLKIDNKRSTQQILDELKIQFRSIEEFLKLSIEEKVLAVM